MLMAFHSAAGTEATVVHAVRRRRLRITLLYKLHDDPFRCRYEPQIGL